jgi:hypothetical protein
MAAVSADRPYGNLGITAARVKPAGMTGMSSFRLAVVAGRIWYVTVVVDAKPGRAREGGADEVPIGTVRTERSSTYVRESTHTVKWFVNGPQLSLTASRPSSFTVPSTMKRPVAISERMF